MEYNYITPAEERFVIDNDHLMTISNLCSKMGRSKGTIDKLRKKLGLSKDFHKLWSDEEKNTVNASNKLSNKELGALLGRTASSVGGYRKHNNIRMERVCLFCDGDFISKESNTKVCTDCNPSGKHDSNSPMVRYAHYKEGANVRDMGFDLTEKQFFTFWQLPCAYCNSDIKTIGLDRVNSKEGYHINNVVPCCKSCNQMKMADTKEDWINQVKKILINLGEV